MGCRSTSYSPSKGYDSDRFRATCAIGCQAVIPSTRARSQVIPYDKYVLPDRNRVERSQQDQTFFAASPPYEKRALIPSMLCLVGVVIWLR